MFKSKTVHSTDPPNKGLWQKCISCQHIIYNKEFEELLRICPKCHHHYPLTAYERIQLLTDSNSFEEKHSNIKPKDFLNFQYLGTTYHEKLKVSQAKTGLKDAIITGKAKIDNKAVHLAVMEFAFLAGSMGSVVGEKIARTTQDALKYKTPLIIVASSGGARMHEGLTALMQMAKTSAMIQRLQAKNLPYIVILTNPTYGGVTASFAMLGDIIISEPQANIGFAGRRVIEQTLKQSLPKDFQTAELLQDHGFLDMIVQRKDMKSILSKVLEYTNVC